MARIEFSEVEVKLIEGFGVFRGYLSMGVRGLSILVVTWTTVVLLGGFVSVLGKKDFWCLTIITLVQTAGVFDVSIKESVVDIWKGYTGLFVTMQTVFNWKNFARWLQLTVCLAVAFGFAVAIKRFSRRRHSRILVIMRAYRTCAIVLASLGTVFFQPLLFAMVLFPLAALYVLGLYISAGLSAWRLIQRDYGVAEGDASKANLTPALIVLYFMALLQGTLFAYKQLIEFFVQKKVLNKVAGSNLVRGPVSGYLKETRAGGRSLATYAVELLESRSPDSYVSGVRLMAALPNLRDGSKRRLLTGLASSSYVVQRLLLTLDRRSPYDGEVRKCAASIVEGLAGDVSLEQFPGGVQRIASLLDDHRHREQGIRILRGLAADEDNRRIISKKIVAPADLAEILTPESMPTTEEPSAENQVELKVE